MLKSIERAFGSIARRRLLSCALIVVLTFLVRIALLPILPKPEPQVHDEFSYILGAETFADGRLTTPTPPLWRFFETFHVNMQPTYASKYPPGQALFLALGILLFGHPWYGVPISVALMCGCICWMLQGWMPPKYALMGGFLALLQFGVTHYWMNSYWGGGVAAIGGALLFGALPRLARDGGISAALAAAVGIAILANSRPFEGSVFTLLSVAALIVWTRRRVSVWLRPRVVLVCAFLLLSTAGAMAYYNFKVTGSALTFSYSVNQKRYSLAPLFWLLPPYPSPPRMYRDESMRRFWEEWDFNYYTNVRKNPLVTVEHLFDALCGLVTRSGLVMLFFAAFAIPLVRSSRLRLVFGVLAVFLCAMTLDRYTQSHYLAPGVGAYFVIVMSGFRWLRSRRLGRVTVAALVGVAVALDATAVIRDHSHGADSGPTGFRAQVSARLGSEPGKQLVLVHYLPTHDYLREIVYNTPDIDSQKIIWAFDFGPEADRPLLNYYRDRKVWIVQPDGPSPTLEPYRGQ
jgi:hypothetical protein